MRNFSRLFYPPTPFEPKAAPRQRFVVFTPQDDITTAELAGAVRFLTDPLSERVNGVLCEPSDWDSVPEGTRRHWKGFER